MIQKYKYIILLSKSKYINLQNLENSSSLIQIFYTKDTINMSHVENIKNNKNLEYSYRKMILKKILKK